MTTLLVLAGGFGTRLRQTVTDVPKPLAPVNGEPYLQFLIAHWVHQGAGDFVFLLHDRADAIKNFLTMTPYRHACQIRTLTEPIPLGTGGAIANAVRHLNITGDFLIANADTWLGNGIAELESADVPAMALVHVEDTTRYGHVSCFQGKVTAFAEKQNIPQPGWINSGLCRLTAEMFTNWDGQAFSLEQALLPTLVEARRLNCIHLDTDFIDIGIPDDYFRFCRWIESGKATVL